MSTSSRSTPTSNSGSATPPSSSASSKPGSVPPKPKNVFSNDGSFLERFRQLKEEDDRKKDLEVLERKKKFDNRFRNRGKRPPPATSSSSDDQPERQPAKRPKISPTSDYGEQVKSFGGGRNLQDTGTGVRPLFK
ncbi:hypothetical protein BD779DRAFT_1544940 [Infundibulicybe gibba]|nr:hypothetical protein BD779DRAFT_1544940 [Infundibulicybe gibba]